MSETGDMDDGLNGDEALAAEYVLGTLLAEERQAVAARLQRDDAFAALVARWETRLAPLNDGYDEIVPDPGLLPGLEARLFGQPEPRRPLSGLRAAMGRFSIPALGGFAAAAIALIALIWATLPGPPAYNATLRAEGQAVVFVASYRPGSGELTVTRTEGPAPQPGHDYELWSVGSSGTPAPLGLVSAKSVTHRTDGLAPGITLAVSLEPAGGSPNGAPTQVLVSGKLSGG